MGTRTDASTAGVVVVMLGVAFFLNRYYDIDAPIAIALLCIPTGIYIALVPKQQKDDKFHKVVKLEAKKESSFWEWPKIIGYAILFVLMSFLIAYQVGGSIGILFLVVAGGLKLLDEIFRKRG